MQLTKEQYKKVDRLNKRIDEWNKKGVKSFAVEQTQDMLLSFYDRNGFDISKMTDVKFRKKTANMTQEQIDEMMTIADAFEIAGGSKVSTYLNKARKAKKDLSAYTESMKKISEKAMKSTMNEYKYVTDFASFVRNIDRFNNMDNGIKEYYDSDEVAQIYDYGYSIGLSDAKIEKIMKQQIRNTKTAHDKRYEETVKKLNAEYNKLNKKVKRSNGTKGTKRKSRKK